MILKNVFVLKYKGDVNEIDVISTGCEKLVLSQLYRNMVQFWTSIKAVIKR
jgi:hypothetical protein